MVVGPWASEWADMSVIRVTPDAVTPTMIMMMARLAKTKQPT